MVCVHDRYGTLLFRTKCDLVKAVTVALGKGRKYASPIADCGASSSVIEKFLNHVETIRLFL